MSTGASIDLAMDKASRDRRSSMHNAFEGVPADLLTLAEVKMMLLHRVATDAEAARLNYITLGSGKAMSYAEKAAEARLILDDEGNPPPAELVPILAREAAVRGLSLLDMARLVMSRYLAFKDAEAAINEAEVRAVMSISAASDAASARAAYEAVQWPSMQ
jgi:hypothetical protein